jgi:hypothetical protein
MESGQPSQARFLTSGKIVFVDCEQEVFGQNNARRNTKLVSARAAETNTPGTCAPRSEKFE